MPNLEHQTWRLSRLRDAGVITTINTDDPILLQTTLVDEYLICQNEFEFSPHDIVDVARSP